jgi:hypothetical protein
MEHLPEDGIQCDTCSTGFKDADELAKHQRSHETGRMDRPSSDNPGAGNQRPIEGLSDDTTTVQPVVGQTPQDENPPTKGPISSRENGFVDAPGSTDPVAARSDARRDASPNQRPILVNVDPSSDA